MTASSGAERHLSPEGFAEFLAAGVPVTFPVPGQPVVSIFIDPQHHRIGLRAPNQDSGSAPPNPLENLHTAVIQVDGVSHLEIAATAPDLFSDVYAMLCAVADRIQLDGNAPLTALEETLTVWGRLIAHRKRLSDDQEVGLFGELLLLQAVMRSAGEEVALASWRGPLSEEHDFGFAELDAEVKTTSSEIRRHWISTLTQLVPSVHRPLWLISIQITRAGAEHGQTLPDLIATLGAAIQHEDQQRRYRDVLMSLRWSDDQHDLYEHRWSLRSRPRAYLVDSSFPALTSVELATLGSAVSEITQVRYEIDVTHRDVEDPTESLANALQLLV